MPYTDLDIALDNYCIHNIYIIIYQADAALGFGEMICKVPYILTFQTPF